MNALLSVDIEKLIPEQKIVESLNEGLETITKADDVKINHLQNINQMNISENSTDNENMQINEGNQEICNSQCEIKLENRQIKKEECNKKIHSSVEHEILLKENIIIKNSYELTLDLLNTIKHINDAEYLLKKHNKLLNKAMQDILHKIESDKFNVVEGYKLAKKIQVIRNEKNLIRTNLAMYKQLNGLGVLNKEIVNKLDKIISDVENEEDIAYEPKILKDLNFRYDNEKIYKKYDDIKKENFIYLGIDDFK